MKPRFRAPGEFGVFVRGSGPADLAWASSRPRGRRFVSNDTKWIVGAAVVLAGLLSAQIAGVNARVDDLRADLTTQIAGVNARPL